MAVATFDDRIDEIALFDPVFVWVLTSLYDFFGTDLFTRKMGAYRVSLFDVLCLN